MADASPKKKRTRKKPPEVKWRPSSTGKSYGWRYPDGTAWNYRTNHPHTGKGGKGVKKSAAHRRAISAALKKHFVEHPEARQQRAERATAQYLRDKDARMEYMRRATVASTLARKKRKQYKAAVEAAANIKFRQGACRIKPQSYSIVIHDACNVLPDIVVLPEQPDSYYEEILAYFRPQVLQALKKYYNKK